MSVVRVAGPDLSAQSLYALLTLRAEVFVVEQDCVYLDLDGKDLSPATTHFYIADATTVTATLRVITGGGPNGEHRVGRVCTARSARGSGQGALLMAEVVSAFGSGDIYLESQSYAAAFYARFGFVQTGPEFLEDDIPHVPMVRPGA